MTPNWPLSSLDDLVEEVIDRRGVTPLKLGSDFTTAGHRVISAKLIKGCRIDLAADDARFVDDATYRRWMRSPLRPDDVLLTSEAPLGETAYVNEELDWCLGQRLFAIRTKKERLHGQFLYYALRSGGVRQDLQSRATGTTVQGIRQSQLRLVRIPVPPLPEQRAIADMLGVLDDKIDLNRRMNETLEAMARALFKSWFVDFDPVRAKAEGRDTGLPPDLAALFPDRFADSELGEIPSGWRPGTLTNLGLLNPETWSARTRPRQLRYVDLSNTKRGRIETTQCFDREAAPSRAQRVLRPGDTIVGTVRPGNGSYALVFEEGLTGSTGFAAIRPRSAESREALYLAATAPENIDRLAHLADGAAYPAVRPEVVLTTPVAIPPASVLSRFSVLVAPLLGRFAASEQESHTLAALRDALLPKLLSGEVRVGASDETTPEAV
jgi:type I restriction enzyme S subunit